MRADLGAALAVLRKEWLVFVRYPTWVVAVLVWPVLFPAGYVFFARTLAGPGAEGMAAFRSVAGTEDYVGYILFGVTLWMVMNMALWTLGGHLRQEQLRGTLEASWTTPARRVFLLLGAGAMQLLQSLGFLVITLTEARLIYGFTLGGNWALLGLLLVLSLLPVVGLGMLFASLVLWLKETNAMVFLVRGIFMTLCGMTYPVETMPAWMQAASRGLPLTHAIRALRLVGLGGQGWEQVRPEVVALALFSVVCLVLGLAAFGAVERLARSTGNLGHY